jgi:hypothetical protein
MDGGRVNYDFLGDGAAGCDFVDCGFKNLVVADLH